MFLHFIKPSLKFASRGSGGAYQRGYNSKFETAKPVCLKWLNGESKYGHTHDKQNCRDTINDLVVLRVNTCRAQCYKTFYHGNLLPFHGNTIILCYKAILPW